MSERELDSSINDYIETETSKNYIEYANARISKVLNNFTRDIKPKQKYYYNLLKINCNGDILDCKIKEEDYSSSS